MWAKMKEEGVPFPRLSERDASDLIAYLHYVQYMGATGNATRGRDLFRTKGCAYCHALGGTTAVGPDLFASKAVQSPAHWASAMWNHAPAMKEKAAQEQIAWPRFEGDEMRDLVAFLRAGDTRGEGKR
jgi:cytochrome c